MTLLTKNIALMKTEVQKHIAADAVVGGEFWVPSDNAVGGTGCFIGCLTHSNDPRIIEQLYGLPVMLTFVVENIFDWLTPADKPRFFGDIPAAIDCDGKDLTRVVWAFFAEELRELPEVSGDVQAAIDPVIAGMDLLASGGRWSLKDARLAVRNAASAADRAARVYHDACAYHAASAADRAARAYHDDRVYHASSAADRAARVYHDACAYHAARKRQAARILRLIAAAPVVQDDGVIYDT